jgi:hypothetical protein
MPVDIKLKNSVTATNAPTSLQQGEVAINVTDRKVWVGNAATTPVQLLGTGATGNFSALTCTTLTASGVATFSAGTVSAPAITTTGDTNTGIFFPAADTIAFTEGGVESMRITDVGNVGIGTSSPAFPLDVQSNASALGIRLRGRSDGISVLRFVSNDAATIYGQFDVRATDFLIRALANIPMQFWTNDTERMRVHAAGGVSIGNTTPRGSLHSQGNSFNPTSGNVWATTASFTASGAFSGGFALVDGTAGYGMWVQDSGGSFAIGQGNTSGNLTERMRITSAGNVGIGTSSPFSRFQVSTTSDGSNIPTWFEYSTATGVFSTGDNGSANGFFKLQSGIYNAASTNNLDMIVQNKDNNFDAGFRITSGSGAGSASNNGYLSFSRITTTGSAISATERMRIDSSGNVLVNTTINPATSCKFVVSGNSDGSFNPMQVVQEAAGSTSRTSINFYRNSAAAGVGAITTTNTATAYVTSSDYRLKENIAPMTGALNVVSQLNPVTYSWKIDGSDGQGFIAHELQAVVPECVTGEKDAVDADGKPQYQGIDTSFLVATLTAAIQEQQAMIETLTTRLNALEGK